MNEETALLVRELADSLGTSAEKLMEWFIIRAPYEFVDPVLLALLTVCGIRLTLHAYKAHKRLSIMDSTAADYQYVLLPICAIGSAGITILGVIGFGAQLRQAIMAMASPEAYAFAKIVHLIRLL